MRVGVLELLIAEVGIGWSRKAYTHLLTCQYVSIMPQAVSVWCRELGHETFYATYYGQADPKSLLPNDLDVVFISAYTQASALAYALARLYKQEKTLTVIGGPHAKAFPEDSLRFFDVVVRECDRALIAEILSDLPAGETVSSGRPLRDLPAVEERVPELETAVLFRGRALLTTTIPVLASVGCPYSCDFCTDWNTPYALLPLDRLEADLRFVSQHFPRAKIGFQDPNFAVKFDQVLQVLERIPSGSRNPYAMESSLSILRGPRLQRLRETNCWYVAPGIESWMDYSNKTQGGTQLIGERKLDQVVEHFEQIRDYVPGIQANFIFGIDSDKGDAPVELTKAFMTRAPFVWPTVNIPTPFGGTPLYDQYLREGRILTAMPFAFYYAPYLVVMVKHYDPESYYEGLFNLFSHMTSQLMLLSRARAATGLFRAGMILRTLGMLSLLREFREILGLLKTDRGFRAFHEHETDELPPFYEARYREMVGPYADVLTPEDRRPILSQPKLTMAGRLRQYGGRDPDAGARRLEGSSILGTSTRS